MAPFLDAGALVLSLQNGVENAATMAAMCRARVVPAVVYVATAMPGPGCVRHHGRGDLVIGPMHARPVPTRRRWPQAAGRWSTSSPRANVPVRISADVRPSCGPS